MTSHAREILKRDPYLVADCVADQCPVVSFRLRCEEPSGARKFSTQSAHCLVCGAHDYCHSRVWRYDHAQWCETCRAPFAEECAGCLRKSKRVFNIAPNKCDAFIERHTASCGAKFASVADWFDLKKPAPKQCAVANRKTDRKRAAAAPKPAAVETPLRVVPDPPPQGTVESEIREAIADAFPTVFDEDWREAEDEAETPQLWREMLTDAGAVLDRRTKQLDKLTADNRAAVEARVAKTIADANKRHSEEIRAVETERIAETERANRLRDDLDLARLDLRTAEREANKLRADLHTLRQLLTSNNIDYDL